MDTKMNFKSIWISIVSSLGLRFGLALGYIYNKEQKGFLDSGSDSDRGSSPVLRFLSFPRSKPSAGFRLKIKSWTLHSERMAWDLGGEAA
jgi:hypothetical protein